MLSSYPIASTPVAALPDSGSIGAIAGSSGVIAYTEIVLATIGQSVGSSAVSASGTTSALPRAMEGSLLGFGALAESPLSTSVMGYSSTNIGTIVGSSTAEAYTEIVLPTVGTSIGSAVVGAVGVEWGEHFTIAESVGSSSVTAITETVIVSVGSIVATSEVLGVGAYYVESAGVVVGTSLAYGVLWGLFPSVATSQGTSTVSAAANAVSTTRGSIAGTSVASATPISSTSISSSEYLAFVEIPTLNLLWSTDVGLKDGVWASPLLSVLPEPSESLNDAYGISSVDNLKISIADTTLNTSASTLVGETLHVTQTITNNYEDDHSASETYTRTYTVKSFNFSPGVVTLNCVDIENDSLTTLFPTNVYRVEEWPNILAADVGKVVPETAGVGLKLSCILVEPTLFKYAVVRSPATILNIYRGGRLVPSSEYTVGTQAVAGYSVVTITFAKEQKDFSGNYYVMEADCTANSTNAASELLRVMTAVGLTVNSANFADAVTVATNNYMVVDIGYRSQRTASTIINDLLIVLRASLYRGTTGYEVVQDISRVLDGTWDESLGDSVEVTGYAGSDSPSIVEVEYKPNVVTPDTLTHVISKSAGGYTGTKRYKVPFISDHQSADRLLDYLAKRHKYGAVVTAQILSSMSSLNDHIRLTSPSLWTNYKDFSIRKVIHGVGKSIITAREYNSLIYTYEPQTYPEGVVDGYLPDYSKTLPLAPTSVLVDQSATFVNTDGTVIATARGSAIPPAVNWAKIYVQATNTLTNEIYQAICSDIGGGRYGAKLSGLRPGQAHTLVSWAENAFGVQGVVSSPVSFTSAGYNTLPAAPTSITATQGSGKVITVVWSSSTTGTIVDHYDIYRSTGGTYTKIASGTGSYADTDVYYGSTYYYKVKAVDRSGNQSYDSSVASRTLAVNVDTPDLVDSGVTTDKIIDDGVTTGKRQHMNSYSAFHSLVGGEIKGASVFISLPKTPSVVIASGVTYVACWIGYTDASLIQYTLMNVDPYGSPTSTTVVLTYW